MIEKSGWQPGEIPVVNRSGEAIPAGSLAKINGLDATLTSRFAVIKPNFGDQTGVVAIPEAIADGKPGLALGLIHPRWVLHSEGTPPTPGDTLGAQSGAWTAGSGSTLKVWTADSSKALVTLAGGGPSWGSGDFEYSDANPQPVGETANAGDDERVSRGRHVHAGVSSFGRSGGSAQTGAVTVSAGNGITIVRSNKDFQITNSGVRGITVGTETLTGTVTLLGSDGIDVAVAGQTARFTNSGVLSLAKVGGTAKTGALSLLGSGGVEVEETDSGFRFGLDLTGINGYDAGAVQVLGHDDSGVLTWYDVDECD
jgi:hypothetical protein